jgi:toxin YoeB
MGGALPLLVFDPKRSNSSGFWPFQRPPSFEKLVGDLAGAYSRRINIQHRMVYQILEEERIVKILRMWTHYE